MFECLHCDGREIYNFWYWDKNNVFQITSQKKMIPHYEETLLSASNMVLFVPDTILFTKVVKRDKIQVRLSLSWNRSEYVGSRCLVLADPGYRSMEGGTGRQEAMVCGSLLTQAHKNWVCTFLSNSAISDVSLVAWYQPWKRILETLTLWKLAYTKKPDLVSRSKYSQLLNF